MTTTIDDRVLEALDADDLAAAVAAATAAAKARPTDTAARLLLIDCLILSGDLARADKQADMAQGFSPEAVTGFGILRNQLRGLFARAAFFAENAAPSFPLGPTACDQAALRLNLALSEGDTAAARAALEELEAARGEVSATIDGKRVDDLRDLDDRIPHALEVLTSGGVYLWVDLALVEALALEPVARLRDIAVRRARLTLTDGSSADVLIPAIYAGAQDDAQKLGRRTDFVALDGGGPTKALGARAFLAGEDMVALAGISRIARHA